MNMHPQILPATEYEREISAVDNNALAVISRQEIDVQIATAHRFPRSLKAFRQEVAELSTLNHSVAGECSYALPRDGKLIEGPSIRFAEILLSSWGNCRSAARIVGEDDSFVTAQGMFHDLQKNSAVVFEVRRRITDKYGKRYGNDMIGITGGAAASIALRDAILRGVPKGFWADLWEQARNVAKGDHKTLANRRAEAVKMFQGYGINPDRLTAFLGITAIEEINTDHLLLLRGMVTAFREGQSTPEQVFGDQQAKKKPAAPQPISDRLDAFARGDQPTETPPAAATPQAAAASAPPPKRRAVRTPSD